MNKISNLFQKISGYISIAVFAIVFVYALGMATPAQPCTLYNNTKVVNFYSDIMPYNNGILILAIVGLLISAFYYILRNHVRQVFYVSNFVWGGLYAVFSIVTFVFIIISVVTYKNLYMALDFEKMNTYWANHGSSTTINPNTCVFALGFVVAVLVLLSIAPYVFVYIDKIKGRIRYEENKKDGVENPVSYVKGEVK